MTSQKIQLSIGIMTFNEEANIRQCLESADFADQVIVVDSGSTDKTVEIAQLMKTEVFIESDWQGFGEQRNRILKRVKHPHVFFLDADEVISETLKNELIQAIKSNTERVWEVTCTEVAYGKTLKYMKATKGMPRLFETDNLLGFEGIVHEKPILKNADKTIECFRGRLMHHSRPSIIRSLEKLSLYAKLGAQKRLQAGKRGGLLRGGLSASASFFKFYILRRGFTGGAQGFLFCFFLALECFFRYVAMTYDHDALLNPKQKNG